jgi:hypothetical protein
MRLYRRFEQHMLDSGVDLTTVECELGERPFQITTPHVRHVKVRTYSVQFNKENLLMLGFSRMSEDVPDWKEAGWIDADVSFRDPHWASETVHALQQYSIVQPWSDVYLLGPREQHISHSRSFCRVWHEGGQVVPTGAKCWDKDGGYYPYAHPGLAWAIRRRCFNEVGGLIQSAVVGSGDNHTALALVGHADRSYPARISEGYKRPILAWQQRALRHINKDIGFVLGTVEHLWHGRTIDRKYWDRWELFIRHGFDPDTDLKINSYGVMELAGNKPALTHDIDLYMRQRNEDGNVV